MKRAVQPEMLTLAREVRGYSGEELASALLIPLADLFRYESGLLPVPGSLLKKITQVLGYPEAFFFQPEKRYGFSSNCTYQRKPRSLPLKQLRSLLARINLFRIHVSRLMLAVDLNSPFGFPSLDIDEFEGDVERIASLVRNMWRLPLGPVVNLIESVEAAGGVTRHCSFNTTRIDVASQWVPGAPPLFLLNVDLPGEVQRWSLAHAIGHLIMHRVPTPDMEAEADNFAAGLLMPARELEAHFSPGGRVTLAALVDLKLAWKVPIVALIQRARAREIISHSECTAFLRELDSHGSVASEPGPIPAEQPRTLRDLIETHQYDLEYNVSDLAHMLSLHEHEVVECYLSTISSRSLRRVK